MTAKSVWAGRAASGLIASLLLLDSVGKLLRVPPVVEGTTALGYPASTIFAIGLIELACIVAYLVPATSAIGAVLLTGYLGGAIATHVRIASPLFTHALFPVYVAALVWGGLFLRDERVRCLISWRRDDPSRGANAQRLAS